jgi:hypothetical protein
MLGSQFFLEHFREHTFLATGDPLGSVEISSAVYACPASVFRRTSLYHFGLAGSAGGITCPVKPVCRPSLMDGSLPEEVPPGLGPSAPASRIGLPFHGSWPDHQVQWRLPGGA